MSAPRDFNGIVREWLESGPTLLSERAFDAALTEVHRTRQRRPMRFTWRLSAMNTSAPIEASCSRRSAVEMPYADEAARLWFTSPRWAMATAFG